MELFITTMALLLLIVILTLKIIDLEGKHKEVARQVKDLEQDVQSVANYLREQIK